MSLKSGAEYRAFGVQSLFGEDVLEFLIKPESVTDRNWEGDAAGQLVTYRSMAGVLQAAVHEVVLPLLGCSI